MHDWIVPLLFFTFFIGAWVYGWFVESRRVKGLNEFAQEIGLELAPVLGTPELEVFFQFPYANHQGSGKVGRAFTIDNGETKLSIFDYSIASGSGKEKKERHFTLALVSEPGIVRPAVRIMRKSLTGKLFDLVSRKSIAIETDPAFSQEFHISGVSETEIQAFLTPARIKAIRDSSFRCLEMFGPHLLIEHDQKAMRAATLRSQMASTLTFAKALRTDKAT